MGINMKISEVMKDKMADLYQEGYSTVEISKLMDCSYETVRYHLIKRQVPIRKNGEGVSLKTKRSSHFQDKIQLTQGKFNWKIMPAEQETS